MEASYYVSSGFWAVVLLLWAAAWIQLNSVREHAHTYVGEVQTWSRRSAVVSAVVIVSLLAYPPIYPPAIFIVGVLTPGAVGVYLTQRYAQLQNSVSSSRYSAARAGSR